MKTQAPFPHPFEFTFTQLDTLIQVEYSGEAIVIRATRDTFTDARKDAFIHELAAEGFIPDAYQWYSVSDTHPALPLCWIVDYSWLNPDNSELARSRRIMFRILGAAAALWIGLMVALFTGYPG